MMKLSTKFDVTKNKGFTIIELLIYVAIFSMMATALASFSGSISSSRMNSQLVFEVNDQGSRVMKVITQSLRNASQVNSPTIGNTASNLSITTYNPATNPTVFSLQDGSIFVSEGSNQAIALTNNKVIASDLIFSNLSYPDTPNIIKISFNLTATTSISGTLSSYTVSFDGSGALRR